LHIQINCKRTSSEDATTNKCEQTTSQRRRYDEQRMNKCEDATTRPKTTKDDRN